MTKQTKISLILFILIIICLAVEVPLIFNKKHNLNEIKGQLMNKISKDNTSNLSSEEQMNKLYSQEMEIHTKIHELHQKDRANRKQNPKNYKPDFDTMRQLHKLYREEFTIQRQIMELRSKDLPKKK